jgi:putative MATE family efflux protein
VTAVPIGAGLIFQTLYYVIDLYFVAQLGDTAIAGVGAAGNIMFITLALTQVLSVGAMALISQAAGRKDRDAANVYFNQSLAVSAVLTLATLVAGYAVADAYADTFGADPGTAAAAREYLYWVIPGLALQFPMVAMGAALRGTGIVKPGMFVQMFTVVLNAVLAPVLIAGWGTGTPLGVAGGGLATTIAVVAGNVMLAILFVRQEKFIGFDRHLLRPRMQAWRELLRIGVPAGGEFLLLFIYMGTIYWVIRDFGAEAQAGFGVGSRVMQSIFLPAMAVAWAAAPIAGQNFGAQRFDRVRQSFRTALLVGTVLMGSLTIVCQLFAEAFIGAFTSEAQVVAVGGEFLRIISWNFVASGVVFTCSSMFQGLGYTWPALLSTASRLLTFAIPALWLSSQPWLEIHHVWYVSVASMTLQAIISLLLLRREFGLRLPLQSRLSAPLSS